MCRRSCFQFVFSVLALGAGAYALLQGGTANTAIGTISTVLLLKDIGWAMDDVPGEMVLAKEALLINLVTTSLTSYACLTNKAYAPLISKIHTGRLLFNFSLYIIFSSKFNEIWGAADAGDSKLTSLIVKNQEHNVSMPIVLCSHVSLAHECGISESNWMWFRPNALAFLLECFCCRRH
jgi:hypothetical protein